MKRFDLLVLLFLTMALLVACGKGGGRGSLAEQASGDMKSYERSAVNAVEQARPQIMVIPADKVLQNFRCLQTQKEKGRTYIIRDYNSYLLKDYRSRPIISYIQNSFIDQNFPLNDFEQTLKQLDTHEATDLADGLEKDTKTLLLTTARPDIILELDYFSSKDKVSLNGHNYGGGGERTVSYTLSAFDAYNNKSVATISATNIKGESTTETILDDMSGKMPKFQQDLVKYFSDILTRGRDITVRFAIEKGCNVNLSDTSIEGDTYADWIMDYMKTHTVKGAYKMQNNTDKELSFTNCRIKLLNDDGTQYGVYDWSRDCAKNLRKNLGLKVANKAQGLGEVLIVIQKQ